MQRAGSDSSPGEIEKALKTQGAYKSRILIVDDNQDSATTLAALFEMLDHEARVAFDGVEAVKMATSFRPDVVLLDIGLPKMNGLAVARKIREQEGGQAMFLVAVTGWGDAEHRRQTAEAGFDLHLVKPVDAMALENALARRQGKLPINE